MDFEKQNKIEYYQPYNQLFLQKKEKKKNIKKILEKAKVKKIKKARDKILEALQKKRRFQLTKEEIVEEIRKAGSEPTEEKIILFQNLYPLNFDLKEFNFPISLFPKKISFNFLCESNKNVILTTDHLFWGYYGVFGDDDLRKYGKIGNIKKVCLASKLALIKNESFTFEEGYVQDYDKDFFFSEVNSAASYDTEITNKFNSANDFFVNSNKFKVIDSDNFICIYPSSYSVDDVKNGIKKTKIFSQQKGILSKGLKEINKSEGLYYFQQTFNLENFFPSFVLTNWSGKELRENLDIMFTLELDYNALTNEYLDNKKIDIKEICRKTTWENIKEVANYIRFLYYTEKSKTKNNKELLSSDYRTFIQTYEQYSQVINEYIESYKIFKKICLSYLDSFVNKVNIEKLERIGKLCNDYSVLVEILFNNADSRQNITAIANFFESPYLTNYLSNNPVMYVKEIQELIKMILSPNRETDLEELIRGIALNLRNILLNSKNCIIPEIRSPCSFLGNTIGKGEASALQAVVDNYRKKLENKLTENDKINMQIQSERAKIQQEANQNLKKELFKQQVELISKIKENPDYLNEAQQKLNQKLMQEYNDLIADKEINKKIMYLKSLGYKLPVYTKGDVEAIINNNYEVKPDESILSSVNPSPKDTFADSNDIEYEITKLEDIKSVPEEERKYALFDFLKQVYKPYFIKNKTKVKEMLGIINYMINKGGVKIPE